MATLGVFWVGAAYGVPHAITMFSMLLGLMADLVIVCGILEMRK